VNFKHSGLILFFKVFYNNYCIAVDLVTDNKDKDKLIVTKFHELLRPSMELYSLRLPCTANGNANGTLPFSTKKHFDIHTQAKMWGNPSLLI
jgi:hypothetical protein